MAIQEQCEKCTRLKQSSYGKKCSFYGTVPNYNGNTCDKYESTDSKKEIKTNNIKGIFPFQSAQESYNYAYSIIKNNNYRKEQVKEILLEKGLSEDGCNTLISIVNDEITMKRTIYLGITFFVIGLGITLASMFMSTVFGGYIVAYGAIVAGIVTVLTGLLSRFGIKKRKKIFCDLF